MKKSENRANEQGKEKKSKWGLNDITAVFLFVLVAFGIAMQF
ncbi:hypothetical protein [Thalassomonas haliotis]|nr:hypothetical protein [Thalassomonas haliotis]